MVVVTGYLLGYCHRRQYILAGAFAKLLRATISYVMSLRLSVRTEQLDCHWTDFHEIWYLRCFDPLGPGDPLIGHKDVGV
jgi:hypothetical protein